MYAINARIAHIDDNMTGTVIEVQGPTFDCPLTNFVIRWDDDLDGLASTNAPGVPMFWAFAADQIVAA